MESTVTIIVITIVVVLVALWMFISDYDEIYFMCPCAVEPLMYV